MAKYALLDWKKDVEELKVKPELNILRDMWIDFLVTPKSLGIYVY